MRQTFCRRTRLSGRTVWSDHRHVRDKAIPTLRKSLDEPRILGRVPEGIPQLPNGNVESLVEITETFVRPDSAPQLLSSDDFSGTLQQYLQQFHGLLLDSDPQTRFAHLARIQGNLVSSESHNGAGS